MVALPSQPETTPFASMTHTMLYVLALAYIETLPRMERDDVTAELHGTLQHHSVFEYREAIINFLEKYGVADGN